MGLFGQSSAGDTSSGLNLGTGGDYGSKMRSPSFGDLDLSSDPSAGSSNLDLAGGDFAKGIQLEQQKATLMSQVNEILILQNQQDISLKSLLCIFLDSQHQ